MKRAEFVQRYLRLVHRDPGATNRQLADALGLSVAALCKHVTRAHRTGELDVWRVSHHHHAEIAGPGVTNGYGDPSIVPSRIRERERRARGRRARGLDT